MTDKRKDVQIFMMCHRDVEYGLIDNSIITPIQCGADVFDNNICKLKDNQGEDNISKLNEFYLENTAIYWIWKNVKDAKYKGQMQYRRRLPISEYLDFDRLFNDYDAIIAEPLDVSIWGENGNTVEKQHALAHCDDDLKLVEQIIKEWHPEYSEDYDNYIKNGKYIFYSQGWVTKADDYDKYCEFLFPILKEWAKRRNIGTKEELKTYVTDCINDGRITCSTMNRDWRNYFDDAVRYQMRIGGSLAERIFTLYAFHNFKRIYTMKYEKEENLFI